MQIIQDNTILNICSTYERSRTGPYLRMFRYFAMYIVLTASALMGLSPVAANAGLLFKGDFETGNFSGWGLWTSDNDPKLFGDASIVTSPRRGGKYAAKFDLVRDNTAKRRTELNLTSMNIALGKEYWYGWSTYLPAGWTQDRLMDVIANAHAYTGGVGGPPFGVNLIKGKLQICVRWDAHNPPSRKTSRRQCIYEAPYQDMIGKWTDFVMRVKWSWNNDGLLEIWKNGKKIASRNGPNAYNDGSGKGPYLKIGIYKPKWNTNEAGDVNRRVIFHDEIRIAGPGSSYSAVAPGGNTTFTQTNQSPTVNAGTDQSAILHSPATVQLNGIVKDEGLPNDTLTTTWSKVSGPGEVVFADASALDTTATFFTEGSYVLRLTADDGQTSTSSEMTVVVSPSASSKNCLLSNSTWQNTPMPSQSGKFMADFDAWSADNGINALTAISAGAGTTSSDFAVLVRFNDQGRIDVLDGTTYRADKDIPYTAGKRYHFRVEVDVPAHSYSVYVTPEGASEQAIATNYAFRAEQADVDVLGNWAVWSGSGFHEVCNFVGGYPNRTTNGLVALYGFEEGFGNTIKDISGVGLPLNLTINNELATMWVPGGLVIDSPTLIASKGPATKLIDAVRATDEITLEAWIAPANTNQNGPARIVTLSADAYNRNLTLGQDGSKYQVRLRTTTAGNNGMNPYLTSSSGALYPGLSHVVYTRNASGVAKLYVDGELQTSATIKGDLANWDNNYRLALGNELTKGRPWLGEYQMLAIYSRVLSADEVKQNFQAGPTDGVK